MESIPDKVVYVGEILTFTVEGHDPDGDPLKYNAEELPKGAVFINQKFKWRPVYNQVGDYLIRFTVSDNNGASDDELVKISVIKPRK